MKHKHQNARACLKISFIQILFLFLITSCFNGLGGKSEPEKSRYVDINGTFHITGAVPSEIAATLKTRYNYRKDDVRTAFPSMPEGITYFAEATAEGEETVSGTVQTGNQTFTIPGLKLDTEWTITVGIKNSAGQIILSDTYTKEITDEDSVFNHDFLLKPHTSTDGTGKVSLEMTVPSTVYSVKMQGEEAAWPVAADSPQATLTPTSGKVTIDVEDVPSGVYNVIFQFMRTDNSTDIILYCDVQTINVFDNMTTNTWLYTGGDNPVKSNGSNPATYELTQDMINAARLTNFYVAANGDDETGNGTYFAPFASIGRVCKSINSYADSSKNYKIFVDGTLTGRQVIMNSNAGGVTSAHAKSITIIGLNGLDGDGFPQDVLDGNGINNSTITIQTPVKVTVKNLRITNGRKMGIDVQQYADVTLDAGVLIGKIIPDGEELSSTNCGNKECGISNSGKLTINGSRICGNEKGTGGVGGISNSGTLIMNNVTVVKNAGDCIKNANGGSITATGCHIGWTVGTGDGIKNYGNLTLTNSFVMGCGHFGINTGTDEAVTNPPSYSFVMTNGSIEYCTDTGLYVSSPNEEDTEPTAKLTSVSIRNNGTEGVTEGGGVYCEENVILELEQCIIEENNAKQGGGLYCWGKSIKLKDCTITDNTAVLNEADSTNICGGGGIWMQETDMLILSGSTVLEGNYAKKNNEYVSGGAIYEDCSGKIYISGNSYIKKDSTRKHDVYFSNPDGIFIINGALSLPAAADGVAATVAFDTESDEDGNCDWNRGDYFVEANQDEAKGDVISSLSAYINYFELSDSEWSVEETENHQKFFINSPIYIAGTGKTVCAEPPVNEINNNAIGNGTKGKPVPSINDACKRMDRDYVDYKILVDGHIKATEDDRDQGLSLGGSNNLKKAKSVSIEGIHDNTSTGFDETTAFIDIIDGNNLSTALSIDSNAPVTIKNIKITGGNSSYDGGGIKITEGVVTLEDYVLITGNTSGGNGGGVYVLNMHPLYPEEVKKLKLKGNAIIWGNTSTAETPEIASNVYLEHNATIEIAGPLKKTKNGSVQRAKIGITTYATPSNGSDNVTFTENYGDYNVDEDSVIENPGLYFRGDVYGVLKTEEGEAALGLSKGNFTVEDVYEDVTLSIDKNSFATSGTTKIVTVSAALKDSDGNSTAITTGTGTGTISYTFSLSYHGDTVPSTYYTANTTEGTITLGNSMPAGLYTLNVTGVYNQKSYFASFEIDLVDVPEHYVLIQGRTVSGSFYSPGTEVESKIFIEGRNVQIKNLIASDHEVTQGEYEEFMTYYGAEVSGSDLVPATNYGKGANYPAYYVCWYEYLMYCNLKSIADGLTPVYYLADSAGNEVANGRDISTWRRLAGSNIAVNTDGKFYYNSTDTNENSVLAWTGSGDSTGGIRMDVTANGWRLPVEVEWEYLARGGDDTKDYKYSGSSTKEVVAWHGDSKTHEIRTKRDNSIHLYDMSGNVWEACWDGFVDVVSASNTFPNLEIRLANLDPENPELGAISGQYYVFRGGSISSSDSAGDSCMVNYRYGYNKFGRAKDVGFRIVRTAK